MTTVSNCSATAPLPAEILASLGAVAAEAKLPTTVREHLGSEMRAFFASVPAEEPPDRLLDLIAQLDGVLAPREAFDTTTFRKDLLGALPGLRAFAMSLAVNPTFADDLVQETLVKAWANQHRFQAGSNFKAWLCTILRNHFYTECRKRRREVEDADGLQAGRMTAPADQEHCVDLQTVWTYLAKVPPLQREALMLVAA